MDLPRVPQEHWGEFHGLFEEDGSTPLTTETIALLRALRGEVVRNARPTAIRAQGQPLRHMTSNASPITDAGGRVLGAGGSRPGRDLPLHPAGAQRSGFWLKQSRYRSRRARPRYP